MVYKDISGTTTLLSCQFLTSVDKPASNTSDLNTNIGTELF